MPFLFKRISFEVAGQASERTLTLSSGSNDGHYISLRPLLNPSTLEEKEFPWEWAFAGTKDTVEVNNKENGCQQIYNFWFDANVYLQTPNTHRGPIDTFWATWESGLLKETGTVYPFGKDKDGVDFVELWQPVDAQREEFVIQDKAESKGRSVTFKVDNDQFYGLVIVVGRWAQGVLAQKGNSTTKGLNFIRSVESVNGDIKNLIQFGSDVNKFPSVFTKVKKGDEVEANGLTWNVIEAYF